VGVVVTGGYLHHGSRLEGGGLRDVGGGVALLARLALGDDGLDEVRQLDVEGLAPPEEHVDVEVLRQELPGLADLLRRERGLFVGLRVHEDELIAVPVEVLQLVVFDVRFLDPLAGAETAVEDTTVLEVLQLRAHEGPPLAGLHVLEVDDGEGLAIQFDLETVAEL